MGLHNQKSSLAKPFPLCQPPLYEALWMIPRTFSISGQVFHPSRLSTLVKGARSPPCPSKLLSPRGLAQLS